MSYPVSCPVHGQRLFLRIFLRVGASDNSHLSLGWALSGRCDGFQYAISELPAEWLAPLLVTAFSLPIAPGLFWGVPKYQIGLPYFRKIRRIVVNQRQAPPPPISVGGAAVAPGTSGAANCLMGNIRRNADLVDCIYL